MYRIGCLLLLLGALLLGPASLAQDGNVPDRLLFVGNFQGADYDVYVGDLNSLRMRALTNDDLDQTAAIWSPDGTQIAYREAPMDTGAAANNVMSAFGRGGATQQSRLVLVDADGGNPLTLAEGVAESTLFAFAPDGQRLAYVSDGAARDARLLRIIDLQGNLLQEFDAPNGSPALLWTADGSHIVYSSFAVTNTALGGFATGDSRSYPTLTMLDVASGEETLLAELPEGATVRALTLSADAQMLYFIQRTTTEGSNVPTQTLRALALTAADAESAISDLYTFALGDEVPLVWDDFVGMSAAADGQRLAIQLETRVPVDTDIFLFDLATQTMTEVPIYDPLLRYDVNPSALADTDLNLLSQERLITLLSEAADNPLTLVAAVRDLFQPETAALITAQTTLGSFIPAESLPAGLAEVPLRELTLEQSMEILRNNATQAFMVEQVMRVMKPVYASARMPDFYPLVMEATPGAYRSVQQGTLEQQFPLSMLLGQTS